MTNIPMRSHCRSLSSDEIHRIQQSHILFHVFSQRVACFLCSPCSEVYIRPLFVSEFAILSTRSCSVHSVTIKGGYALERLRAHNIVEILVHIQIGDIFPDPLPAASHHLRYATRHPLRSRLRNASIDGSLKSGFAAEAKTYGIRNVSPGIFCFLSAADENRFDILKIVIGVKRCAICFLQFERIDVQRELCSQLLRQSPLACRQILATIRVPIQPFVGHICMIEISDRTITNAGEHIISSFSSSHSLNNGS